MSRVNKIGFQIWCDFDRASSLICGNKMPTRCNRGFYSRSYCFLNMFQVPLCPSSGAQEYYTVVATCDISCCGFQVVGLVWSWGLCVRFAGCLLVYCFCFVTSKHTAYRTHNPWKPQVCASSLQMHAPVHHFHIHKITPNKRDTWNHRQKPPSSTLQKTYQEHPHTAPTTLDTPYNKPR